MTKPNITEVREHLMATLAALRDRDNPMDVDRARAVAQVAGVLVDTAKVEVDYIKATKGVSSGFLEVAGDDADDPPKLSTNPWPGQVTRHTLQG